MAIAPTAEVLSLSRLAFLAYASVYGFRKPWTVGSFADGGGRDWKSIFAVAQTLGYCAGKLLGLAVLVRVQRSSQTTLLLCISGWSVACWMLFALLSGWPLLQACVVALSSCPLAFVWSLMYRWVEGRRGAPTVNAFLAIALVISGGLARKLGQMVLESGVPEVWVPAVSGLLVLPVFSYSVWHLSRVPPPTAEEVALYGKRSDSGDKDSGRASTSPYGMLSSYPLGMVLLSVPSAAMTALRDLRSVFQADLWRDEGDDLASGWVFLQSELLGLAAVVALLVAIQWAETKRRTSPSSTVALMHAVMGFSGVLCVVASVLLSRGAISMHYWFSVLGVCSYLVYVPLAGIYFDWLVAMLRMPGSATIAVQAIEAAGYLGSVAVLLLRHNGSLSTLVPGVTTGVETVGVKTFLVTYGTWAGLLTATCCVACHIYFFYVYHPQVPVRISCSCTATAPTSSTHSDDDVKKSQLRVNSPWRLAVGTMVTLGVLAAIAGSRSLRPHPRVAPGLRVFVDADSTLAHTILPRQLNNKYADRSRHSIAMFNRNTAVKGAAEALALFRAGGAKITVFTSQQGVASVDAGSAAWLLAHNMIVSDVVVVSDVHARLALLAATRCTPATCVLIDGFQLSQGGDFPAIAANTLCNTSIPAFVEVFDLHYNNWQGIARRYFGAGDTKPLPEALQPAVRVTNVASYTSHIAVDRARDLGLRVTGMDDWDVLWLTMQTPATVLRSAAQGRLLPPANSTVKQGWVLPGGLHQRANAIPGASQLLNNKRELCKLLHSSGLVGNAPFLPCFALPEHSKLLVKAVKDPAHSHWRWIYKPAVASNGIGVQLLPSAKVLAAVDLGTEGVVQRYLETPVTYKGFKTDIRLYALVPSMNPPRIYMHKEGYARVAGEPYDINSNSTFVHVTNVKDGPPHVRLQFSAEYTARLLELGIDPASVWRQGAEAVWQTVLLVANAIGCSTSDLTRQYVCGSNFQQLAIDLVVSESGEVWFLELNPDPSLKARTPAIVADDVERDTAIYSMAGVYKPRDSYGWYHAATLADNSVCSAWAALSGPGAQAGASVPSEVRTAALEFAMRRKYRLVFPPPDTTRWETMMHTDELVRPVVEQHPGAAILYQQLSQLAERIDG
jgi:hypothetical protein